MTHHPIRTLPDGTRLYSNGAKYKPVPDEQRKYRKRKPDVPGAVMYNREWWLPLDLVVEEERGPLPATRPDSEVWDHASKPHKCKCTVCRRPENRKLRAKARRRYRYQMRMAGSSGSTSS